MRTLAKNVCRIGWGGKGLVDKILFVREDKISFLKPEENYLESLLYYYIAQLLN